MNCDFCSLGEKWGLTTETREYDEEETVRQVREYAENGVRWIVLRTTEFYSKERLGEMIRTIRTRVPARTRSASTSASSIWIPQTGCTAAAWTSSITRSASARAGTPALTRRCA